MKCDELSSKFQQHEALIDSEFFHIYTTIMYIYLVGI